MTNAKPTSLVTGRIRISYEHLLKAYAQQPGAEEKYSVTILLPKSDIATKQRIDAAISAAINDGVTNKWKGVRPPNIPNPIWDGDGVRQSGEPFGPECKGCWVFTASSKNRPEVVDANVQPILDSTQIYSGMYARISINFFPYDAAGKRGIGCGLGNVQKLEDGEPLGGRTTAADDFGGASAYQQAAPAPQPQYQQPVAAPQWGAPPAAYQPAAPAPQPQYQQPATATPWGTPPPAYQPQIDPITGQPIAPVYGL